jgi:hypothetical protein
MSFEKNKYVVIKEAISKEIAKFSFDYFMLKREVAKNLFAHKIVSPFETMFGEWDDIQCPNTYSHYADILMETLLLKVKPIMEKTTNLKLVETYSYARIYKKGDVLHKHVDRMSCEVSTTLNLGGDPWAIFIKDSNQNEIEVNLSSGDMLVYRGCELEHWRNEFTGNDCAQVFLHYNDINSNFAEKYRFDRRPQIGLPKHFKKSDE